MAGPGKKWLIGCGLGCGIPFLLFILLTVGGSMVMMKPFNRAVDAQRDLQAAYGEREEFVPPAAGLTADRLARFLAVRGQLEPMCEAFTEIGEKFKRMEILDREDAEPSKKEVFQAVGDMMGGVFGIAGNIGRFTEARNQALLANEMGLGEYIWIYVLVYNSWLGHVPNTDFEQGNGGRFDDSDQKVIRALMRNHAGALTAAGRPDEAKAWESEVRRLERSDGSGVPWSGAELPAGLVAACEPLRAELEAAYCEATAAFEMSSVHKKGLTYSAD